MDISQVKTIAQTNAPVGLRVNVAGARETVRGWYFPFQFEGTRLVGGSNGLIVDKVSGRAYVLGSAFSLERDLSAFDHGFRFGSSHLIVRQVRDVNRAATEINDLRVSEVTPEFAHGVEWKIPKQLTQSDIGKRLQALPAKFGPISVYFAVEALQRMQASGTMDFELQEVQS